jgi:hypothetical protein
VRTRGRVAVGEGALALGTAAGVATLGGAHGGYFPTSWGWCALALAWVAAMALLVRADVAVTRLELATVGAFAALAGWYALSALWSESVPQTVLEAERALVYPLAAAAALLVCRRSSVSLLLGGVWGGISLVSLYALATRLFPERIGVTDEVAGVRLAAPLGYWNALGVLSALGTILLIGLVADARGLRLRAAAAATAWDAGRSGVTVAPRWVPTAATARERAGPWTGAAGAVTGAQRRTDATTIGSSRPRRAWAPRSSATRSAGSGPSRRRRSADTSTWTPSVLDSASSRAVVFTTSPK